MKNGFSLSRDAKKTEWCKTVEASFLFGERPWDETLERHILWTVTEKLTQVLHKETQSPAVSNNFNKSSTRAIAKVTFFTSFYSIFANPPQFSQDTPISYGVTILSICQMFPLLSYLPISGAVHGVVVCCASSFSVSGKGERITKYQTPWREESSSHSCERKVAWNLPCQFSFHHGGQIKKCLIHVKLI